MCCIFIEQPLRRIETLEYKLIMYGISELKYNTLINSGLNDFDIERYFRRYGSIKSLRKQKIKMKMKKNKLLSSRTEPSFTPCSFA